MPASGLHFCLSPCLERSYVILDWLWLRTGNMLGLHGLHLDMPAHTGPEFTWQASLPLWCKLVYRFCAAIIFLYDLQGIAALWTLFSSCSNWVSELSSSSICSTFRSSTVMSTTIRTDLWCRTHFGGRHTFCRVTVGCICLWSSFEYLQTILL